MQEKGGVKGDTGGGVEFGLRSWKFGAASIETGAVYRKIWSLVWYLLSWRCPLASMRRRPGDSWEKFSREVGAGNKILDDITTYLAFKAIRAGECT